MSLFEPAVLGEKVSAVARHLDRVQKRLPALPDDLATSPDAADVVVLHLWQAIQIVIDLATSACFRLNLGAPAGYADAFVKLADGGHIDRSLCVQLIAAAGLRNRIAHAYAELDLRRVHEAATHGPNDLEAFLAKMASL